MHYLSMRLTPSTTWNLSLMLGSNCFTGEQTDDGVQLQVSDLFSNYLRWRTNHSWTPADYQSSVDCCYFTDLWYPCRDFINGKLICHLLGRIYLTNSMEILSALPLSTISSRTTMPSKVCISLAGCADLLQYLRYHQECCESKCG